MKAGWLVGAVWLVGVPAFADDAPDAAGSVAVSTVPAVQGSLPRRVVAYGTATPGPGGSLTLSLQQDGRVAGLDVAAGQSVQAGQSLVRFALSPGAVSTYAQAVTALGLAQSQRAHAAQLLGQRLATRDQVAAADKAVSDAQSTLAALRQGGGGAASQTLRAPFAGVVSSVAVAQGERVSAGAALLVLSQAGGVIVQVGLEPDMRGQVRVGQRVLLQSLDGAGDATGQVSSVAGALDPKSRLLDATIAVAGGTLMAGGAYSAAIAVGAWQGWVVPHEAVLNDADGFYVFQRDGAKAHRVMVQVLGSDAIDTAQGQDVISGGLNPRLPVIVDGAAQLDDGGAVRDPGSEPADQPNAGK